MNGNLDRVRQLVEAGVKIDGPKGEGVAACRPLFWAAMYGHEETVTFLLSHEAKADDALKGNTPLLAACWKGHYSIAKLLLDHGANPNTRGEGGSPLQVARDSSDARLADLLRSYGAKE